jgi:hypothetical protein
VKITVLYRDDGRIVSLAKTLMTTRDDSGVPALRMGVEPGKGQRVATIDLDQEWQHRSLDEIHEQCVVVAKGDTALLKARRSKR